MKRTSRLRLGVVLVVAGLAISSSAGSVAAKPNRTDITGTSAGKAEAADAAAAFKALGADGSAKLRVVRLENGGTVVVPAEFGVDDITLNADGSIELSTAKVVAQPASTAGEAGTSEAAAAAAPYWLGQGPASCYRLNPLTPSGNDGGNMDWCWRRYKLIGETDSRDYWNIHVYATVDAVGSYRIGDWAWMHVDRDGGGTWAWEDWNPRGDVSGNCSARTLGISALGIGFTADTTVCETWSLTKYAAPGELKVQWDGNSAGARELDMLSTINVTSGASPAWGVSVSMKVICYQGTLC